MNQYTYPAKRYTYSYTTRAGRNHSVYEYVNEYEYGEEEVPRKQRPAIISGQ